MQKHSAILYVIIALTLAGCGTQSVYLQNIQVEGPLSLPPVRVVDEEDGRVGQFRLSLGASVAPEQTIEGRADRHTLVNAAGVYQVDTVFNGGLVQYIERNGVNTYPFQGRNFHWNLAPLTVSFQGDLTISPSLALAFGFHYSRRTTDSYLSLTFGSGFFFYSENIGVRIDVGGAWTTVRYDVDYVITRTPFSFIGTDTYVQFFRDQHKTGNLSVYGAFMLNTRYQTWPLQLFLQLALLRQNLIDLDRTVSFAPFDGDIRSTVLHHNSFFIVTPGVVVPITLASRIVLGIRLTDETSLLVGEPGVLLAPFAYLEFTL